MRRWCNALFICCVCMLHSSGYLMHRRTVITISAVTCFSLHINLLWHKLCFWHCQQMLCLHRSTLNWIKSKARLFKCYLNVYTLKIPQKSHTQDSRRVSVSLDLMASDCSEVKAKQLGFLNLVISLICFQGLVVYVMCVFLCSSHLMFL